MSAFRIVLWVTIALLGGYLAWSTVDWTRNGGEGSSYGTALIGGPFSAVLANGKTITRADMLGRPHAIFFGFTHCPDVCPTTLYEAGLWLQKLGDRGNELDIYFVTVDPERDTPEVMSQYLSAFHPRIQGITGSVDQVAEMLKAWKGYARKVANEDGSFDEDYNVDHTATTYLMNKDGSFFGTVAYGEDIDVAVSKIKRLLEK